MRFFKPDRLNWKYILGEIILIFIGINSAIWFNNWNTSNKASEEKQVAISRIKEEIGNNLVELKAATEINNSILSAWKEFNKLYDGNSSNLITSPDSLLTLEKKYPGFYRVTDSVYVEPGLYRYSGTTFINLELPEITEIAWETTRSINITNNFNYDCLYRLESMYSLQRRLQKEIEKSATALQNRKLNDLMNILEFTKQLDSLLQIDYREMLDSIENCE